MADSTGGIEVDSEGVLFMRQPSPLDEPPLFALNGVLDPRGETHAVLDYPGDEPWEDKWRGLTRQVGPWLERAQAALVLGGSGQIGWRLGSPTAEELTAASAVFELPGTDLIMGDAGAVFGFGGSPVTHTNIGPVRVHWIPPGNNEPFAQFVIEQTAEVQEPAERVIVPPGSGRWTPAVGRVGRVRTLQDRLTFIVGAQTSMGAVEVQREVGSPVGLGGFQFIDPNAGLLADGTAVRIVGQRGHVWLVTPIE